jgi:hypothetical protein
MTKDESGIDAKMADAASLCPLCRHRTPDTTMKFHYTGDKHYDPHGYDVWKTRSMSVPVCTRCSNWWKWVSPYLIVTVAVLILIGFNLLSKNAPKGNIFFTVGSILFMLVGGVGCTLYFVRGYRIKKWMKVHTPNEAKGAGLPY